MLCCVFVVAAVVGVGCMAYVVCVVSAVAVVLHITGAVGS